MIEKGVENAITERVKEYYNLLTKSEIEWVKLESGYSNQKFLLKAEEDKKLAICKIYQEDSIISAKERMKREKKALEFFKNQISPKLIWTNEKNILCYSFIEGTELVNLKINTQIKQKLKETLSKIHTKELKETNALDNPLIFYKQLHKSYSKLEVIPDALLTDFKVIMEQVKGVVKTNKKDLSYIHGDLVPANILVNLDNTISLIDWEYFRIDLPIFDYVYVDYYGQKHELDLKLIEQESTEIQIYKKIISLLNKMWWLNYKKRKKNKSENSSKFS